MVQVDLSKLPNEVVRSALCETVENLLKSKNHTISVSSASQSGENNFVGELYRISFNEESEVGAVDGMNVAHKLILKVAPQRERVKGFTR